MTMDQLVKIVAAFASLFALYKIVVDVVLAKSTRGRQEYNFSKNYLQDLKNHETHRFVLEKGFTALTGKTYGIEEIRYLMDFGEPSRAIRLRPSSMRFLDFDSDSNQYCWKKKYQNPKMRAWLLTGYMGSYAVLATLAILPVLHSGFSFLGSGSGAIFSSSLGVLAIGYLVRHEQLTATITLESIQPLITKSEACI